MKASRPILAPLAALALAATLQLRAQELPMRAAYEYSFGKAWSAAADLPALDVIDLGRDRVPMAVNDGGTVLLRNSLGQLLVSNWGSERVLLEGISPEHKAFLNEAGEIATVWSGADFVPMLSYWPSTAAEPVQLQWGSHFIGQPFNLQPYAFNDLGEIAFRAAAKDHWFFFPPETLQTKTCLVSLRDGSWADLAEYSSFNDIDFTVTAGGSLLEVQDLNNYHDTVGVFRAEQVSYSSSNPEPVYTYQEEYFALNRDGVLGFEPLRINDARHILGRSPGPLHGMVILDAFGQRDIGPPLPALAYLAPEMSSPLDGHEEIVLGTSYWKRMGERDLFGIPTGSPSPDFWMGNLRELVHDPGPWMRLEATCISAGGRIAGSGWHVDPVSGRLEHRAFMLMPALLVPDWDRNGSIDQADRLFAHRKLPWRFWINNDDDTGDHVRSSADDLPYSPTPDWANPGVDGLRDGVDFFPVLPDLQRILQAMGDLAGVAAVLRHQDGALNLLLSSLQPAQAGRIHEGPVPDRFGPGFDQPLASADTVQVTPDGLTLPERFLKDLRDGTGGLLFLEARGPTTQPLQLELRKDGRVVLACALQLSISPVEDMFRLINLRNCDPKFGSVDPGPWLSRTAEPPNMPDRHVEQLCQPLRTLVHVHGYNWSGDESPAAHAELFKRFFQAGSNARFVGVSWRGDEGTMDLTGKSLEYNENVINAFVTAGHLAAAVAPFSGPFTSVFAHSLGNMVTSSAIVDHGLDVMHFFMVNAAVPSEAYIGETAERRLMVHPDWKDEPGIVPDYNERFLAVNWHRLFAEGDNRSALRWKDRFGSIPDHALCFNFYSSGEDVLRPGNGDLPALFGEVSDTEEVWTYNEMIKGTSSFTAQLTGDVHAGWGFNRHYMKWVDPGGAAHQPAGDWVPRSPTEAESIDSAGLVTEPFFRPFASGDSVFPLWGDGAWLYGDTDTANSRLPSLPLGQAEPGLVKNHAKVLAEGLPAHSAPAGSTPLRRLLLISNIDMDTVIRDTRNWPLRSDPDKRDRWLHGDYLYPSFAHVSRLYRMCVAHINFLP